MTDDTVLDALIVRNIGDLEATMLRVHTVIGERLWQEAADIVQSAIDAATWYGTSNVAETDVWIAHRSWSSSGGDDTPVMWLGLDEVGGGPSGSDESWLAAFVGDGPSAARLALMLEQEMLGKTRYRKLLKDQPELLDRLQSAGFRYQPADNHLYLPIDIDREALAKGFEEDDLGEALAPIAAAVNTAVDNFADLDTLAGLIRQQGA